ncbi:MAG: tRNA pseudouridine(55) synthase TruB [Phycisphaeraceae bacterium]
MQGRSTFLTGLLIVDKPAGPSSMDVVRRVRHVAGGAKTGHAGTLDPLATGVVICCLGRATRCVEQLMGMPKTYETRVDLSAFSTTDDLEGELTPVDVPQPPTRQAVDLACARFVGSIKQVPPAHSAARINGRRAYRAARRGEKVDLPAKTVHVHAIDVLNYDWPNVVLRIACGRGTYVRSLARDLGTRLGTGGHVTSLRRTAVGPYTLERAVTFDHLTQPLGEADLLPVPEAG